MRNAPRSIWVSVLVSIFVSDVARLVYEIAWRRYLALFLEPACAQPGTLPGRYLDWRDAETMAATHST